MAVELKNSAMQKLLNTPDSVCHAVDVVRAAGREVSEEAISILNHVDCGEIDTDLAVLTIIRLNTGG